VTARRRALGRAGEELAVEWYVARGWEVLDRNWRVREGELDVIAWRQGILAVCEVKTRTTDAFGTGAEAVTWRKQKRIRMLVGRYLATWPPGRPRPRELRFDVADITAHRIDVIEGAF